MIRLGLIGDNIAASSAPRLHALAGALTGQAVRYDRLVPRDLGLSFDQVFDQARNDGRHGLNITYPYKEKVCARLHIPAPEVAALGAVNTVLFGADQPEGWNTDYTGFMAAYRAARAAPPGRVGLIGCGGVGRAIGFALARLGAAQVWLIDQDAAKAQGLARDIRQALNAEVRVARDSATLVGETDALVNATPVGMTGYGGCPVPKGAFTGKTWAFDAVYTPEETEFLTAAGRAGAQVIPGWELFFWQGVDAFALFTGTQVDPAALRRALRAPG